MSKSGRSVVAVVAITALVMLISPVRGQLRTQNGPTGTQFVDVEQPNSGAGNR